VVLTKRFPSLAMNLDPPAIEKGPWFLFIHRGEGIPHIAMEWRPDRGFGISTPSEDDYGEGTDEIYSNVKAATDRAIELIETGGRSVPPDAVRLAELRKRQGLSQGELAARAGMKQANVSQIESRGDVLVSTLAKMVEAMGGELSIRAKFPGGVEQEIAIVAEKGWDQHTLRQPDSNQGRVGHHLDRPERPHRPTDSRLQRGRRGRRLGGASTPLTHARTSYTTP